MFASQTLPEGAGSPAVGPSVPNTLISVPELLNSSTPASMSPTQRSPAALQVTPSGNGDDANCVSTPVEGSKTLSDLTD